MNLLGQKENYRISGRYLWKDDVLYLSYSAAFIEFRCITQKITVDFISDGLPEEEVLKAALAVFINGEEIPALRFRLEQGKNSFVIYESEKKEELTVRIMKYSEAAFASVGIEKIMIDGEVLTPPEAKERLIQVVGDSITCGYGIEGVAGIDTFTTKQENPWEAYACTTGRMLDADVELVSWSGNGVCSHYVDETVNEPRHEKPWMQELYPYTDRELEERMGIEKEHLTVWEPDRTPDVIVIHLGTNDASYTRNHQERNKVFMENYSAFLKQIRQKYQAVPVVCMLGAMDVRLNEQLASVVAKHRGEGDDNLYYLEVPYQLIRDGRGTDEHPTLVTQKKLATLLAAYLEFILN